MQAQINYQKHDKRKKRAEVFWNQVVDEYNSGRTAQEIADNYVNPATGKNYTRQHIYWILKKMSQL